MTPPAPTPLHADVRLARLAAFYTTLTPASLGTLGSLYAPGGRFVDPFNDVTGIAAIRRIFEHMFASLDDPRFEVLEAVGEGAVAYLSWNFRFRRRGSAQDHCIHGVTRLCFDADGLVLLHHDHWDPARQVYEGLPVLGALLRWLRRRLSAGAPAARGTG
jgi:steroid delta-isomerase